MTLLYHAVFYSLAAVIVLSTGMAITRRNTVHAVVYLVVSFIGTAVLFYLLGAPLLAALEVIIYAGAIMVLFLFIIMTMPTEEPVTRAGEEPPINHDESRIAVAAAPTPHASRLTPLPLPWHQWLFPVILGAISLVAAGFLLFSSPTAARQLPPAMASPAAFGRFLFEHYWLPVEIISFLLFVALVGALYLGKRERKSSGRIVGSEP